MAEVPRVDEIDFDCTRVHMIQQHGKGIAGILAAFTGALVAHWPIVEGGLRDASGLTATVSAIYATLYFRRQWKKS